MLVVVANMAIVAEAQVALARRAVDSCAANGGEVAQVGDDAMFVGGEGSQGEGEGGVSGGGAGVAVESGTFFPPHVVFVLHLAAEQLAFRPVYHTTSCDWQGEEN